MYIVCLLMFYDVSDEVDYPQGVIERDEKDDICGVGGRWY
jgi:hypothetical protein